MAKFYAVKEGKKPGIYMSWDECKEQVNGYSGAVYKSFTNEEEAKAFIKKEERKELVKILKHLEFTIKAFRPIEEAIVTSGGVNIKEINPKTMESKIINGLYFAGEIIDVDSYTGGFNLQIAYSTGYTAGKE